MSAPHSGNSNREKWRTPIVWAIISLALTAAFGFGYLIGASDEPANIIIESNSRAPREP